MLRRFLGRTAPLADSAVEDQRNVRPSPGPAVKQSSQPIPPPTYASYQPPPPPADSLEVDCTDPVAMPWVDGARAADDNDDEEDDVTVMAEIPLHSYEHRAGEQPLPNLMELPRTSSTESLPRNQWITLDLEHYHALQDQLYHSRWAEGRWRQRVTDMQEELGVVKLELQRLFQEMAQDQRVHQLLEENANMQQQLHTSHEQVQRLSNMVAESKDRLQEYEQRDRQHQLRQLQYECQLQKLYKEQQVLVAQSQDANRFRADLQGRMVILQHDHELVKMKYAELKKRLQGVGRPLDVEVEPQLQQQSLLQDGIPHDATFALPQKQQQQLEEDDDALSEVSLGSAS